MKVMNWGDVRGTILNRVALIDKTTASRVSTTFDRLLAPTTPFEICEDKGEPEPDSQAASINKDIPDYLR